MSMPKALILCAGNGTRLGYKTKPKVMAMVNGKPILEHLVNHLNKYGITEIIVNVHKNYDKIFKYFGTRLLYLYEPTLLGEAGTEAVLEEWLGDEYIVMNGDTLTNVDIAAMRQTGHSQRFIGKHGRYAGTTYINQKGWFFKCNYPHIWTQYGAYYFDCGTPQKLAKAKRYYRRFK